MIPQTALARKLRRADNQPLACVLTPHGTSGIWKVLHFSNCDFHPTHSYREEPRAGGGGGRPQKRRLADPTSSAGARAVLMVLRNAVPSEPWAGEGGGRPQGLWLSLCSLGAAALGPQEEPKCGRTPEEVVSTYIQNCHLFVYVGASHRTYRIGNWLCTWEHLDVHTEWAIVCVRGSLSTYIQNWQLFVYLGALLGPDLAGAFAPPAAFGVHLNSVFGFPQRCFALKRYRKQYSVEFLFIIIIYS